MVSTRCRYWTVLLPIALCVFSGFLSSCNLLGGQRNNEEGLRLAAERFNRDIRWGEFKSASTWVAPTVKDAFWDQADRMQDRVRVLDYQVVDVSPVDKEGSGTVAMRYRFYQKSNPHPQTKILQQKWLYSKQDGKWQVVGYDLQKLIPE